MQSASSVISFPLFCTNKQYLVALHIGVEERRRVGIWVGLGWAYNYTFSA